MERKIERRKKRKKEIKEPEMCLFFLLHYQLLQRAPWRERELTLYIFSLLIWLICTHEEECDKLRLLETK